MGQATDAWPKECYTFDYGDKVRRIFNGKCGIVTSQRFNCFYQLLWTVRFDDGTEAECVTDDLELIKK